ncbi:hypothetical protein V6N11_078872 [Hibiscus sabdariffa]|uniref:Uncharacterized protein n=1 Tax=Hibiscus sabdariffa TaxID=183260 RepID=A0ABR2RU76_9ROSI
MFMMGVPYLAIGSRIIITTRDEHLLRSYQVDDVYVSKTLNPEDASHLFNLKAFGSEIVAKDDLIKLSKHVASNVIEGMIIDNKNNLVAFLLPYSRIEQLWKENIPLHKLKVLNIKRSKNLIKTPDFTTAPNLEILISEGCIRIVDVHPSIGVLSRLKILNLRSCKSLRNLPIKIGIVSLETLILKDCRNLISLPSSIGGCKILKTLDLSGCFKVDTLPENLQQVELLEELDLSETAIAEPPSFIFQLKSLKVLSLNRLKGPSSSSKLASNLPSLFQIFQRGRMESVPLMLHSLSGLSFLRDLKLRHCNLCEGDIPSDISCLSFLEKLDLGGNNFISAPVFVSGLSRLQYLGLSNCRELKSFADLGATLEVFATPSKVFNAVDWTQFNGLHCYRLVENINAFTMLKTHLKYLEVKCQNGSAIKQLALQSRYHCLTIFRMIVDGSELLSVAFLSMMMLRGTRNSHVKLLSIIGILDKVALMNLFFGVEILVMSQGPAGFFLKSITSPY